MVALVIEVIRAQYAPLRTLCSGHAYEMSEIGEIHPSAVRDYYPFEGLLLWGDARRVRKPHACYLSAVACACLARQPNTTPVLLVVLFRLLRS